MIPLYRIPSMVDVEKIKHNGFNVVSTFSGCGGSCLGYRMAGFNVLWANEFIPAAQDTYKANHNKSILDTRDIRTVKPSDILKATNLKQGELDLFDGSPPCASFSTAGRKEKGWGEKKAYSDTKQRTDDLFFEYIRILDGLRPKVFVAENVSGLIKGTAKGYFKEILLKLKATGYNVQARLLNAKWLGVPQGRERLILMGTRNDLNINPVFPKPYKYFHTIKEVLPHIIKLRLGGSPSRWAESNRPAGTICQSDHATSKTANFSSSWVMDDSFTVRKWTIPELKIISGFPADFELTGTFENQWERIGRAVPPLMMKEVAQTVRDEILCMMK